MKSFPIDLDSLLTVAVGVLDERGVLLEANAGLLRLLPSDASPIGGRIKRFFIQPSFTELLAVVDRGGDDGYRGLLTLGDVAGKTRTLRGRVRRVARGLHLIAEYDIADLERLNDAILELNRDSSVAQRDLTRANIALKQREVQIVEASLTDVLTGVGNRRKLELSLAGEISRVRAGDGALCAIMTDVDHFKRINDEYGHGAGDKVLAHFGALLKSQTRPTDVVARYGGEEFVLLMPHTHLAQAVFKAELIRSLLAAEVIEPLNRSVTSSFGVAELQDDEDAALFMARVDAAMYEAKEGGRNRVVAASVVVKH